MGESIKIVSKATITQDKKLSFSTPQRTKIDVMLKMMKSGQVKLTIESWDDKKEEEYQRTEAQNRYYHKLLDIICKHTGDTHLELHDIFKAKFLGKPYVLDDKEYIVVPSTTSLNSKNFGEYLEKIFAYVGEFYELILPSPEDYY
jgi:hypothetical protein